MVEREERNPERQLQAPLFEALTQHARFHPHPFHVPGHKMGNSFDRAGKDIYQSILSIDLTEISGTDDLHQPEGVIAQAQQLAAEAYGAEETRFLIGGSTVGNIALVMTVCQPGNKIIVQRNCHKSVFNALILARAEPIFIVPAVDVITGIATGLRREDVERTLLQHPDAKAVFLTNPNYYGMGIDLAKMAATVHKFGIPLLVDEAHGAHFGFHPALPPSAMQCGADASVQSTHKMGTSMTMSSMLHIQGSRINRDRLSQVLGMIQSSSPSYPLMASLDLARRHMVIEGAKEIDRVLPRLEWLKDALGTLPWLRLSVLQEGKAYTTLDPFKLLLFLNTREMAGYELQSYLEKERIFPELIDRNHVLLAASTGTSQADVESVWQVCRGLHPIPLTEADTIFEPGLLASTFLREQLIPIYEANNLPKTSIPLVHAEGRIAAEMVIPYPPGIPLLVPGERIDGHVISLLQEMATGRVRFQGASDPGLRTIQVIR
ncbi:aminotransferase class I/II-fold pyridoxal phosphate-dependent enzyme [Brevibacillus sp. SYSU BS000544]|uniref:aminotransferase class I/II-fold pyridoxal phosphate-dependent enzyme n=1 Tax=Brevibacillus sp. SYSU BS000544 TaxID=3416443 RepID=UPI003CE5BEDF